MLRVTIGREMSPITFKLEGKIAGEWVDELERAWLAAADRSGLIQVDLTGVTFVDEQGKKLLGRMVEQGSNLYATDCMNRSIIEQIARKHHPRTGNGHHNPVRSQVR
jgi:anti-anti-sigma regulatory factor